jgi:hypothetical protein
MLPTLSAPAAVKILALEPLAKLGDTQNYWIRVLPDKRSETPLHAVAAMRCEDRNEIHWLSAGLPSPMEAVRWMRSGFTPSAQDGLGFGVIQELIRTGKASLVQN